MKRGLLIGVGTLGSIGAVFAITPPQFGATVNAGGIPTTAKATPTPTQTQAATPTQSEAPAQTQAATPTKKATASKPTKKATATTQTQSAAPAPTQSQAAAPAATGISGTFDGATNQTRYGPVQVRLIVKDGKITNAQAIQYPNGDQTSARISQQAIPYLKQQTLAAQSDAITGVSGASYTSYGWYISLQSALKKSGL